MNRNEIAVQDTWDLTPVYENTAAWEAALAEASEMIRTLPRLIAAMTASAQALYAAVRTVSDTGLLAERLYTYAHLRYSTDTSDNEARTIMGRAQNLLTEYGEAAAPFDTMLLTLEEAQLAAFFRELPALEEEYGILLRNTFRYKPHTLSGAEEQLLAAYQKVTGTAEDTYETFTSSDMKFGTIRDAQGNEVELTDTNYAMYLRSPDREVRKAAFTTLYAGYRQFSNTFASLYAGQVEAEKVSAKVRHYGSALEKALVPDHMTPEIYQNMVNAVSGHLDVLFRYYRLKKKVLGLDEMHLYDTYVPMNAGAVDRKYTYPEAVEEVLNAVSVFGQEYVDILRQGYADRWVDIYPNAGKVGGAFSGG
ncbi:MAG: hypothetical protein IJ595_02475, partial [Oscillospiraceae bacterium]|nr:hypothetical protein [Oscillospiraceae bacterium]